MELTIIFLLQRTKNSIIVAFKDDKDKYRTMSLYNNKHLKDMMLSKGTIELTAKEWKKLTLEIEPYKY